jgi:hypothetical protein
LHGLHERERVTILGAIARILAVMVLIALSFVFWSLVLVAVIWLALQQMR